MPYLLNVLYLFILLITSPYLIYQAIRKGKYLRGWGQKFLGRVPIRQSQRPCIWFHAVSVGEVLLLRTIIHAFKQRYPHWECVLSTTTQTGYAVAEKHFSELTIFYWPLDFTWSVKSALRRLKPDLIVMAELELWPNMITLAKKHHCKLAVINGRMSKRSFRGYQRIRLLMNPILKKIDLFVMQNDLYAKRMRKLGVAKERIFVSGTTKYDAVAVQPDHDKVEALRRLLQVDLQPSDPAGKLDNQHGSQKPISSGMDEEQRRFSHTGRLVWVAGSTHPPEEEIVLDIYDELKKEFPQLQLILAPRHAERFEEAAHLLEQRSLPYVRRSDLQGLPATQEKPAIVLLDTLGELEAAWSLADVAFVGGSFSRRGGQNMIEPAALGVAVTFGPHVWNFQETVDGLLAEQAAMQVEDAAGLKAAVQQLLQDKAARQQMGQRAHNFVRDHQGGTEKTIEWLGKLIVECKEAVAA